MMPKPASSCLLYGALGAAVVLMALLSLAVGQVPLSLADVWQGVFGGDEISSATVIIREIRLPRTLLAILVGAALGLSGAAMQGFLRNPLAEPGLLGVSGGAALGAVLAIYTGLTMSGLLFLPLLAMAGAILAVLLAYALAGRTGNSHTLILAGIAVSSLFGAAVAVALNLAPNPFAAMEVIFWLMGSLADRTMEQVWLVLPFLLLGCGLLLSCMRGLTALTLGETTARSLGIHLGWLQAKVALGVALAVGAAVSVSGSIGFVGLVVPHILRPFVGYQPGRLLPASALGGAVLLLAADIVVRIVPTSGVELRIGVVTALVGAPFFLMLLVRHRKGAL